MNETDIEILKAISDDESINDILPEMDSEELLYRIAVLIDTGYLSIQVTPRGQILAARPPAPVESECTDESCTACSSCR